MDSLRYAYHVPPEIWSFIFHYATHVPGTLIPDIYDHAHLVGPDYNRTFHPRLQEALVTKRVLVRVCKQWCHLTTPYLYQSLYISRTHHLVSLYRTLANSAMGKGTTVSRRPLGEYTQRLDIAARDDLAEFSFPAWFIKYLPSLAIMSFGITTNFRCGNFPKDMPDALLRILPTLRVFDCSSFSMGLSPEQMRSIISECTQLRVLNCPWLLWYTVQNHGGVPSTLTTLRVNMTMPVRSTLYNIPDAAHKPGASALRELILEVDETLPWQEILHLYSSQLVSVQLRFSEPNSVEADMELLAQTCPSLARLIITAEHFSSFIRSNLVFPSISYLGLRTTRHQSTRQDFKTLFVFLEQLGSSVPSLRVVQLLNEHNVCCLFRSHSKLAIRALQPFLEAAPFRVEDREGVLLTDRLRALGHL